MSVPLSSLGGQSLGHHSNIEVEREYDRLRDAARAEAQERNDCYDRSRRAYERGDGAEAKALSNKGKEHQSKMMEFNRQASDYIFRENNAPGRIATDCIDLHGQFVEEAERIVAARIQADRAAGQSHLHVIVGKGNHSVNHITKIRPKVEEICRQMGLDFRVEENAGRIYINLRGGEAVPPSRPDHNASHHDVQQPSGPVEDIVSTLFAKFRAACCVVM